MIVFIRRCCKAPCCHLVELWSWGWAVIEPSGAAVNPLHPRAHKAHRSVSSPLETRAHSPSCGPRQRWIRTQIKKGCEGRGRIVWCESLLRLLRNVELWKWLIWYLKYVFLLPLSSFLIPIHLFPPFVMSVSGCRSSGPGGGYPSVGPRQAEPHCVSEERGQPANSTTQQCVPQSQLTHKPSAQEGLPCLSVHLFVYVCVTLVALRSASGNHSIVKGGVACLEVKDN